MDAMLCRIFEIASGVEQVGAIGPVVDGVARGNVRRPGDDGGCIVEVLNRGIACQADGPKVRRLSSSCIAPTVRGVLHCAFKGLLVTDWIAPQRRRLEPIQAVARSCCSGSLSGVNAKVVGRTGLQIA